MFVVSFGPLIMCVALPCHKTSSQEEIASVTSIFFMDTDQAFQSSVVPSGLGLRAWGGVFTEWPWFKILSTALNHLSHNLVSFILSGMLGRFPI